MTAKTPHFPGKPTMTGEAPKPPHFSDKMCPILTAGELAQPKPVENLVVTAGVQRTTAGPQAVACQGPKCALYISGTDAAGNDVSACAHVFNVIETNRQTAVLGLVLAKLPTPSNPKE